MDKLYIKQLNEDSEVFSERLALRLTPAMKKDLENIAKETNRMVPDVVRIALTWALERIEIVFEETEENIGGIEIE